MRAERGKIRAYVLLGIVLSLSFSLLFSSSGGGAAAGAGETTSWEAANRSCTITAGNNNCLDVFTWPTPLAGTPCTGCAVGVATTVTGSQSNLVINDVRSENFFSLGSTGQTWVNMPAATTEIFGDGGQHWIQADWSVAQAIDLVIICPNAGSTSGTPATLNAQYSTDQGGTWTDLTGTAVDISTFCGIPGFVADSCITTTGTTWGCYVAIPAAAKVSGLWLRIVGKNGAGIGDTPNFVSAYLAINTLSTIQFFAGIRVTGATSSLIIVQANINVAQPSSTTVFWRVEAWICIAGGSGPC